MAPSTSSTTGSVSVGSTSTTILSADSDRKFAVIVNDSDETVYLSLTATALMNQGIRINANGGWYEINSTNLYTGIITGICSSGSKVVTYSEGK